MSRLMNFGRTAFAVVALTTVTACANAGGLGSILGTVLGGGQNGQSGQVSGSIQSVDTRNQVVNLRQSNGQNVALSYDSQTQVSYQNRNYAITDLENGDQVNATVQSTNNGYYVTRLEVTQSANSSGTSSGSVQTIQGNVRQVDQANGWFTVNTNNGIITVTMPYNPSRTDLTRFQSLRSGDYVRLYGTYVNNSRVELRNFY